MDIYLPQLYNMRNPANFKERKRKRINKEKSIYSTDRKVLFLAEDSKGESFIKPPFKYGKKHDETLRAVIAELSISSNPINFK